MGYRGRKSGYYAQANFESHVCGIVTKGQAKRFAWILGLVSTLLVAVLPNTAEAADLEAAVAIKFSYQFGEAVEKSEFRMGLFLEERDHAELEGMGLLELRLTPVRGVHYAVLDKEIQAGLGAWSKQQFASLKGALRLDDLKAMVKDFQTEVPQ